MKEIKEQFGVALLNTGRAGCRLCCRPSAVGRWAGAPAAVPLDRASYGKRVFLDKLLALRTHEAKEILTWYRLLKKFEVLSG
ncbi:hypothetical protein K1X09_28330 [Paenibacillus lautus]|nr:hypothetical protein [Paenibacillus lautus]